MELGVVIGKPYEWGSGKGVNAKDAEEYVFGFVIVNDWSGMSRYSMIFLDYVY